MVLTKKQQAEFESAVRPLMQFLSDFNPHKSIIVDNTHAEIVESVVSFRTNDYIKD